MPVGFEEQIEDPDSNSAIYADDLDESADHSEPAARVMSNAQSARRKAVKTTFHRPSSRAQMW